MKYLFVLLTCLPWMASAAPGPLPERVDKAIRERIDHGEYPAMLVAIVDGADSRILAYGKLAGGKTPDADSVFEIGSVTKTFTATLLAQAVQTGSLTLDTPVGKLLPGYKLPERGDKPITLGNLASQHSGLPRLPSNLDPADPGDPYADYGENRLRAFLAGYTLTRDPGSQYEYSNLGFGLLGLALARHAGVSYARLLDRRIFQPLGMQSSRTRLTDSMKAHLAHGHDPAGRATGNWHFQALAGAGAILSTARDMLAYLQANMGLKASSLQAAMQTAQQPRDSAGGDAQIGLAWMTQTFPQAKVIWHNGMTGGYASFIGFTADRQHGVVILTNAQHSVDDLGFAALVPGTPLAPSHARINLPASELDQYVGTYQLAPGFLLHIFRDKDQLNAQATGQGAFPIFASARNEFFANVGGITLSFQRDEQGKVNALVLHQNGDRRAPRISDEKADDAAGRAAVELDPGILKQYVGEYRMSPAMTFSVTLKDGQLRVQVTGQPAYPVFARSKDHFFYRVVDARIDFERDERGTIEALVLHQAGMNLRAARIVQ